MTDFGAIPPHEGRRPTGDSSGPEGGWKRPARYTRADMRKAIQLLRELRFKEDFEAQAEHLAAALAAEREGHADAGAVIIGSGSLVPTAAASGSAACAGGG